MNKIIHKYIIKEALTIKQLKKLIKILETKTTYDQTSCGCGEGWTDERCGSNSALCKITGKCCIFDVVEII